MNVLAFIGKALLVVWALSFIFFALRALLWWASYESKWNNVRKETHR